MTAFNIKIISDNVCPFCFLGKARLDRAITQFRQPSDTFNISWQAYLLNPNSPTKSLPMREALAKKFGSTMTPAQIEGIQHRIQQMGKEDGLDITHQGWTGHTGKSHRVVQLGKTKGTEVEHKLVQEIMSMYFEHGGDITKDDDLVRAAEKAGIDAEEARNWIKEGKGADDVDREVQESRAMGVQGVPHFIINDKYEIHGAEDVSSFIKTLERAKAAAA